ncbi:Protein-lysine N-methyltransferase rrg1 [Friedmanniomyces endolithicus]|uniref:Protein-lysine N-methyltransferase rrg1 n=1 Tax=Friedmanniomyces endolithicus TaxID=329885 RepID=A0AAN6KFY3_9PEZI|nr:Protein-lysine N-methyltransferase rrg1 [Friedmanniomyces endolithicus]KAK0786530.1 Protein-lysine N-methyltransferase rrg1 [Friedmanniomyces endolithicus]KAK0810392.1 Protein-lysine N-methyltransferase rrg1 [Friedmanniomyces endolithicus]KAK0848458.1 Protein-lysine N-methyltransferase rrg1 [Friedmanniomyces endolithicus]KAK0873764.1 Protein-lysine N-methyltransferase rrg1 [Friedmanniomyces endolithicus]
MRDDEALDVLDLPQLYTKPPADVLLATLDDLTSQPRSWEATPRPGTPRGLDGVSTPMQRTRKVKSEGVPHYLTKIIASSLAWIEDDVEKEAIWEAASQRLSERSGRMAMGDISRTFTIPFQPPDLSAQEPAKSDEDEVLEIILHEPAMTSDSMGLKTWASSYLLAKRLTHLRDALPRLPPDAQILELGAGTGLVGLAAAVLFKRTVVLTDLQEIVPNLERNVRDNAALLVRYDARAETAVLDWSDPGAFLLPSRSGEQQQCLSRTFRLILATDCVYSPAHPALLEQAIGYHLCRSNDARVVVEMPVRKADAAERAEFRKRMLGLGLILLSEGEEVGYDDWGASGGRDDGEGLAEVVCWWSVWGPQ